MANSNFELRKRAEKKIKESTKDLISLSEFEIQKLIYDLRVHQIELEMQTEALLKSQNELEYLYANYLDLFDDAPLGYFIIDKKGVIKDVNKKGMNMLDSNRENLINTRLSSLMTEEDADLLYLHLLDVFKGHGPQSCELNLRFNEEKEITVRIESILESKKPNHLSLCRSAINDISELKFAELEKKKQEENYKHIFQSVGVGIAEFNISKARQLLLHLESRGYDDIKKYFKSNPLSSDDLKKLLPLKNVNQEYLQMFGSSDVGNMIKSWHRILVPQTVDYYLEALCAWYNGNTHYEEATYCQTLNGNQIYILNRLTFPLLKSGNTTALSSVTDISKQKQMEISLHEINRILGNSSLKTSLELDRRKHDIEQLASLASHNLKEPIRTINSFAYLLKDRLGDKINKDEKEFLQFISQGAKRIDRFINGMIHFIKISTKRQQIQKVDLNIVVNTAINELKEALVKTNAQINFEKLPVIYGDREQLETLMYNLLDNAIKFCPDKVPEIVITAKKKSKEILISLRDNGIGIDSNEAGHIFEIFQQLRGDHQFEGDGMGLAVAKGIVENHEGKIWFESQPGQGSIFYFTLKRDLPKTN